MSHAVDSRTRTRERVALVGLIAGRDRRLAAERSLDELAGLASAAGGAVVLRVMQERPRPDPATFLGGGKVDSLKAGCDETGADLVVVDSELTPAQQRHLEERLERTVVDRTQLILDIFAKRARTREGKLQVELAQLKYLLPRLVGSSAALSRLGGGIGTRGPGETKLETDRRRIRTRIHALSSDIEVVRQRRAHLRERRHKSDVPTVALVGYTNAGKTTLFNLLTNEHADATDALFVTLDPIVRQVKLPDRRELLLSDTVGFIDRLPHTLVAAFRATLEEVAEADLVLHVIDVAVADRERRVAAVESVLTEVGAQNVPRLDVFNKCDELEPIEKVRLRQSRPDALCISARTGEGRDELIELVTSRLSLDTTHVTLAFDPNDAEDQERIANLYRHGRVLSHIETDGRVTLEAEISRRLAAALVSGAPASSARPRRRVGTA